ncbi:MAG: AMP-binding protein [Cryobacterium sp.]|nr:AMP-binding protein [Cryobacterium sp.]
MSVSRELGGDIRASDVYDRETMQAFRESGLWRDRVLTDFLTEHAAERPDDIALVAEGERRTWRELSDAVDRIAAGFIGLGLRPGDFVGIQLPNSVEFVETYLAIQRAGLKALTMLTIYREKDGCFMLGKTNAQAYVVQADYRGFDFAAMARRVLDEVPTLAHAIAVGGGEGLLDLSALAATSPLSPDEYALLRPDPDSISKVSFTSGTTGAPKGVIHTHNTDLVPPLLVQSALGLGPDTPIWMPSPIGHVTGLLFGVYGSLLNGAKLVLQDKWDPAHAVALVAEEGAVMTVSATPFIAGMLDVPNLGDYDLSRFRYFMSGGARIPPVLVERARAEMDTALIRVFGSAEAPLHTSVALDAPWEKFVGSDGKAFPGVESRSAAPADHAATLPTGELGEYATRGPHVFLGYLGEPELTAEVRGDDGWFYQGDLCTMDDDGYVLYVDRVKDIVNRGGIKISALEVENELVAHPSIQAVAVVAVHDERLGEKGCAFVVLRPGATLTLDDVARHLEERRVTRQKWPEELRVVEELPMTATGKVRKVELREQFEKETAG